MHRTTVLQYELAEYIDNIRLIHALSTPTDHCTCDSDIPDRLASWESQSMFSADLAQPTDRDHLD